MICGSAKMSSLFPVSSKASSGPRTLFPVSQESKQPESDLQGHSAAATGINSFSFSFDSTLQSSASTAPSNIVDAFSSEDESKAPTKERKRKKRSRSKDSKSRRRTEDRHAIRPKETEKRKEIDPLVDNNSKIVFLKDAGVTSEKAFCFDKRADRNNFAFDETYWKNVPKLRKPPRFTLGDFRNQKSKKKAEPRYFELLPKLSAMKTTTGLRILAKDNVEPFGRNYIPLSDEVIDQADENDDVIVEDDFIRERTKFYNENLVKNQKDVALWLEFLDFQEEAVRSNFASSGSTRESWKPRTAELLQRKLAIVDRAIQSNPYSVDLRLLRLSFCEDLWDKEQLSTEWRKLAFDNPNNPVVWNSYIFFLKSYLPVFAVGKVTKAYQKYFSVSLSIADGTFQSHRATAHHMEHMVLHSFILSAFWMATGHQEKATGYLQAILELNLGFPEKLDESIRLKDVLTFFEPFWDSGVPRIGERNSSGWNVVFERRAVESQPEPVSFQSKEDQLISLSSTPAELWIKLEEFRINSYLVPYHSAEEPTDVDRIIIFDDLSPFLFRLSKTPRNSHHLFSMAAYALTLLHCQMPRLYSTKSYAWKAFCETGLEDPLSYLFSNWTESHCALPTSDNAAKAAFGSFKKDWTNRDEFIDNLMQRAISVLGGSFGTYLSIAWLQHKTYLVHSGRVDYSVKDVRNLAKNLLKKPENRSNYLIWEWYAFAETVLDSKASGIRILKTVLSTAVPNHQSEDGWKLARVIRYYVELLLNITPESKMDLSHKAKALNALICFSEGIALNSSLDIPASRILKARKIWESFVGARWDTFEKLYAFGGRCSNYTICHALFEYLTDGITSARSVLQNARDFCKSRLAQFEDWNFDPEAETLSMDCEIMSEAWMRLLQSHRKSFWTSSLNFREEILEVLKDFPSNPMLLGQFVLSEMAVFVSGNLRTYFESAFEDLESLVPILFALFAEYERKYRLLKNWNAASSEKLTDGLSVCIFKDSGITHKLRALFERAVETEIGRHFPLLWQLYLKFEMEQENLIKAEAVYYRAIQSCPWSKDVYMMSIKMFPHRLQEIIDIMTEKELRVFTPYEEAEMLINAKTA